VKTSQLDYDFPKRLIAKEPKKPRDAARLMVLNRKNEEIIDSSFLSLPKFLKKGDLLVFNKTKVFPARAYGQKESGGEIEILFLEETEPFLWEVMIGGRLEEGQRVIFSDKFSGVVIKKESGSAKLKTNVTPKEVLAFLEEFGHVPLPPYIRRSDTQVDREYYQTIFAEKVGSAAAPTASLHFTNRLLDKLKKEGIETAYITLHVGLGTFAPVKTEELESHPIHSEYYEISNEAANQIARAKKEGRRVIAVGTTVVRALESAQDGVVAPQKGRTSLFITPGFEFRVIDGMITNFHTPRSSLLGLVMAFLGQEKIKKAYDYAIENEYRLFSYGDGMFIG
jgi:S-adenosylmethionine:tRNA ribosyltransferase-isomerase